VYDEKRSDTRTEREKIPRDLGYRPDIDGLRAFAVLSVVVFHAFPSALRGGFVGVDVFFVISGYLISGILFREVAQGRQDLVGFYIRRIRRIFPALLLVLTSCLAFGWIALLPGEYAQLGKHVASGAGFIVNFVLEGEVGYFDNAAHTKPLLHLWSLGIEEQFYIVWPLVVFVATKTRTPFVSLLGMLLAFSCMANITRITSHSTAVFYEPQYRAWELLAGALIARCAMQSSRFVRSAQDLGEIRVYRHHSVRDLVSLSAGAVLLLSFARISDRAPFPGWQAIFPVVASATILAVGPGAAFNRWVLSKRALVWVGLISYPLYLWHWPLLAFARISVSEVPPGVVRAALVLLAIALSWLTYRLWERPLRFGFHRARIALTLALAMVACGATGWIVFRGDGLPERTFPKSAARLQGDVGHDTFHATLDHTFAICEEPSIRAEAYHWKSLIRCFQSKAATPVKVAVIGDSHAEHLFVGLAESLSNENVAYYIRTAFPWVGDPTYENIYNYVLSTQSIRVVVVAAFWGRFDWGDPKYEVQLEETVRALTAAGKTVLIADDLPVFRIDPRGCKYRRVFDRRAETCALPAKRALVASRVSYPHLLRVAKATPNTTLIPLSRYICTDETCSMERDGWILYRDDNHLNLAGSRYVGKRIVEEFPLLLGERSDPRQ